MTFVISLTLSSDGVVFEINFHYFSKFKIYLQIFFYFIGFTDFSFFPELEDLGDAR